MCCNAIIFFLQIVSYLMKVTTTAAWSKISYHALFICLSKQSDDRRASRIWWMYTPFQCFWSTCILHLLCRCIDTFPQLVGIWSQCIPRLAGLSRAEANIAGEPNSSGFVKLVQPDFTQEKQEDEVKHARLEANKGIMFLFSTGTAPCHKVWVCWFARWNSARWS